MAVIVLPQYFFVPKSGHPATKLDVPSHIKQQVPNTPLDRKDHHLIVLTRFEIFLLKCFCPLSFPL